MEISLEYRRVLFVFVVLHISVCGGVWMRLAAVESLGKLFHEYIYGRNQLYECVDGSRNKSQALNTKLISNR